jgi:membrane protease YdiL (CAAX protease family)
VRGQVFALVAITAGVCEEVLVRGYLLWYFATLSPLPVAVLVSSALFGAGHIYLGRSHAVRALVVGLFMCGLVIATHSLWPAILLHAAIDGVSGELAFRAHPGASS